jgi:hypothetical protein
MVFAKLIFFPPKFFLLRKISFFQNTKKKSFGGKKNQLSKKGRFKFYGFKIRVCTGNFTQKIFSLE